jgi:DNA-binding GntR family transcriptional regulator
MLNGKVRAAPGRRRSLSADSHDAESADENAVETAVRELRRMIFDGELSAGQALRQEDLALRLGTSRHPVREALGRLSGEGLVSFRPRHGYTVRTLGPDEIAEIFEIRMLLEEHAGYVATLRRDAAAIADVEEVLQRMSALKDKEPQNLRLWSECNREFHVRLYAASGRPHLCRMIATLRDSMETYIRLSVPDVGIEQIHAEHEHIFNAFRDGDAIGVAKLCRQHVRHTAHSLVERLRNLHASSAGGWKGEPSAATAKRRPRGVSRSHDRIDRKAAVSVRRPRSLRASPRAQPTR